MHCSDDSVVKCLPFLRLLHRGSSGLCHGLLQIMFRPRVTHVSWRHKHLCMCSPCMLYKCMQLQVRQLVCLLCALFRHCSYPAGRLLKYLYRQRCSCHLLRCCCIYMSSTSLLWLTVAPHNSHTHNSVVAVRTEVEFKAVCYQWFYAIYVVLCYPCCVMTRRGAMPLVCAAPHVARPT